VTRFFFILEHYFSIRSYGECQNAFRNSLPDSVVPNKSTIQRLVERFRETGSIGEKRRSGCPSVLSRLITVYKISGHFSLQENH
jgi:hypothetical protein